MCTAKLVYMGLDFVHAMWNGIVNDVLSAGTFDGLDDHELTVWLCRHGMSQYTADNAPWLRGFYDLVFGFEEGDRPSRTWPQGRQSRSMLQIVFNSKGALMWKMNAGMGDVVFSPLYEVLRQRGVKVHFFQRVRRLELSADGAPRRQDLVAAPGAAEAGHRGLRAVRPRADQLAVLAERAQLGAAPKAATT